MPIYEYYCPACNARYQHLARSFDAPTPPCPGCGSVEIERMVSKASLGRRESVRREAFDARARAARDNDVDLQTAARLLQEGGDLLGEIAPRGVDHEVFREIVERRAHGAGDADFDDLVAAVPLPLSPVTSEAHAHPHDHSEHDSAGKLDHSRHRARDLGWG